MNEINAQADIEEILCPSIVFKVQNSYYAINSKNVASIMRIPEYQAIPDSNEKVVGVFVYRGNTVTMLDVRAIFKMPSLKQEYEEFRAMMEQRKQDHIKWVSTLEGCLKSGEPFPLATDPAKCAFGKWYNSYKISNNTIKFHLNKINDPHKKLHEAAIEATRLREAGDDAGVNRVLNEVKNNYMPVVLKLLDEAIDLFGSEVYHEMVLVFTGDSSKQIGLVVDEVFSVENLEKVNDMGQFARFQNVGYVTNVCKSSGISDMILLLDEDKILAACNVEQLA